jgi:hypothetical protein
MGPNTSDAATVGIVKSGAVHHGTFAVKFCNLDCEACRFYYVDNLSSIKTRRR